MHVQHLLSTAPRDKNESIPSKPYLVVARTGKSQARFGPPVSHVNGQALERCPRLGAVQTLGQPKNRGRRLAGVNSFSKPSTERNGDT